MLVRKSMVAWRQIERPAVPQRTRAGHMGDEPAGNIDPNGTIMQPTPMNWVSQIPFVGGGAMLSSSLTVNDHISDGMPDMGGGPWESLWWDDVASAMAQTDAINQSIRRDLANALGDVYSILVYGCAKNDMGNTGDDGGGKGGGDETLYRFPKDISGKGQGMNLMYCLYADLAVIDSYLGGNRTADDFMHIYANMTNRNTGEPIGENAAEEGVDRLTMSRFIKEAGFIFRPYYIQGRTGDENNYSPSLLVENLFKPLSQGSFIIIGERVIGVAGGGHAVILQQAATINSGTQVRDISVWDPAVGREQTRGRNYFKNDAQDAFIFLRYGQN